jgi:hypothetical protein
MTTPLRPRDPRTIGPYELLSRLGEGGMGAVYLGRAPDGQQVAVKVIQSTYAGEGEFRERFRREVAAAKRVAQFCTAPVLDADLDGELPYIVSEYVEGPTLYDVVSGQGPLAPSSLEALAVGIAGALASIHAAGVVHRDLKPSNVLLSSVGPRVIDFGVATALEFATGLTMTRRQPGTPAFMAPEQHEGRKATSAADVFAWGGVIAFAGTGRLPFGHGSEASVAYRVVYAEPDLDGLDPGLRELVAWALTKDPAARPSAQDLLGRLVGGAGAEQVAATVAAGDWKAQLAGAAGWRPGATAPGWGGQGARRSSWGARAGAGAGAGLAVALAVWLLASLVAWRLAIPGALAALAVAGPAALVMAWLALRRPTRGRGGRGGGARDWLRAAAVPGLAMVLVAAVLASVEPTRSPLGAPERVSATATTVAPVELGTGDPLVFEDDFADRSGRWRTPTSKVYEVGYAAGALRVRSRNNFEVLTAPEASSPFLRRARIRFDVARRDGTKAGTVTVHCRDNRYGDYYVVDLEMDGDFRVQKYISGDGPGNNLVVNEELRKGRAAIKGSGFNRVEVACAGDGRAAAIVLGVNGTEVARVEDRDSPVAGPGRVSLGAYSPEVIGGTTPWFEVAIDNWAVWGQPG